MAAQFDYGMGRPQIIGGTTYEQYSPEWYAAMDANKVHNAGVAGTAAGTAGANAMGALSGGAGGGGAMGGLNGLLGGGASGAVGGGVSAGGAGAVGPLAMQDTSAADNAQLARTKDTVGKQSAGALRGLRESLGARGMLGSGLESRGVEQITEAGQGQQGEVARQQQIDNSNRTQHTAEMNYQGQIAQRGQDIQAASAAAQRNQTVLLGLLNALGPAMAGGLKY